MSGTDEQPGFGRATPVIPVPVKRLDPFIGLATAVHAAPGVYGLLLGSGVSTGASIPTGWAIVTDLVRRAAAAADPSHDVPEDLDPERWWTEHGDAEPLGYSPLLNSLAPTPAGRDQILRGYFEASDEDRDEGRKLPTPAHEAIAELVAQGSVRVIVTTNFDRLLERALEQRGTQPQVIHHSDQIVGMTPLAHRDATIVKLHGDYADLDKRNTVDELATYPSAQQALLDRILDEYGLIVCGWSGEWDAALVRSLERMKSRRYPLFWASYSRPTEAAQRLITQVGAVSLENISADDLFTGLRERLIALERLSAPPLTRDLAVSRLKRYLPNPIHRIDTYDLVMDEVKRASALFSDRERYPMDQTAGLTDEQFWPLFDGYVRQYRADSDTLLHLLATGTFFAGPEHTSLWTSVIERLLRATGERPQRFNGHLGNLARYPVLLAMMTVLCVGLQARREDLVAAVVVRPRAHIPNYAEAKPAGHIAHPWRVMDEQVANALPRWNSQRWREPLSHLLRQDLDDILALQEPGADQRQLTFDGAEYLLGLAQASAKEHPYAGENGRHFEFAEGALSISTAIREEVAAGSGVLLADLFAGDAEAAVAALDATDEAVRRVGKKW